MVKHRHGRKSRSHRTRAHRTWMFEPNRAEIGYFLRRFRGRRRRVLRMLGVGLGLPLVLVAAMYLQPKVFFAMGYLYRPTMAAYFALAVLMAIELGILAMAFYYWRCAHCETFAGFRWNPVLCSHCGAKLSRSRHRDRLAKDFEDEDDEDDDDDDDDDEER